MARETGAPTRSRNRGRRSRVEAGRTRTRLLRHAERLFARKGFNATSMREIARASGVRMFTIQHHFRSKRGLYEEILSQWDREVEDIVNGVAAQTSDPHDLVGQTIDRLFDFFVSNRARLSLNARAALGEGLQPQVARSDRSWLRFIRGAPHPRRLGAPGFHPGLLLITIEGLLHNHVLAVGHYRHLYGHDLTDKTVVRAVKQHLTQVILALLGPTKAPSAVGR